MALCRYDYVISAIEGLKKYLDTCANDDDTMAILSNVQKDIGHIEEIEKTLDGLRKGDNYKPKRISPAIEELKKDMDKIRPLLQAYETFADGNKDKLDELVKFSDTYKILMGSMNTLREIRSRLRQLDKKAV